MTTMLSFLIQLLKHCRLVSSAMWWTLQNFVAELRLFIYNKTSRSAPQYSNILIKFLLLQFKDYFFSFFLYWLKFYLYSTNQLTRCFKLALTSMLNFLIQLLKHCTFTSVISKVVNLAKFYCWIKVVYIWKN